jgi:uncharacterized protein
LLLKVSRSEVHGHGCFATRDIAEGEAVATARILVFPPEETERLFQTKLKHYVFFVRDGATEDSPFWTALALGPVSLCNHADDPACDFAIDEAAGEITLRARRTINEAEEITINYGDWAEEIV